MSATAAASGTFAIGGELGITRLGFGAMRITGEESGSLPAAPIRNACKCSFLFC